MKSNELRVGNRFIRELRNSHGLEYDHDFILTEEWMGKLFGDDLSIALEDLFPVPLTPEILVKAGFRENAVGVLAIEVNDMATHLELTQVDEKYFPAIDQLQDIGTPQNVALNYIEYVHQLQNLFFALCGEELPLTL